MQRRKILISYNLDGHELMVAKHSAQTVRLALKSKFKTEFLKLRSTNWVKKVLTRSHYKNIWFLCHHGGFGENGDLQLLLEQKKIVHTHSPSEACQVFCNKHKTKLLYLSLGIMTPPWFYEGILYGKEGRSKLNSFFVKKPLYGGSKYGISLVKNKIVKNTNYIYENLIEGNLEASVGVLGSGLNARSLYPIFRERDIDKLGKIKNCHSYENKKAIILMQRASLLIHKTLNCRGVTKTDFLIDDSGKIFAIETDAIPGLSKESSVIMGAQKIGISYSGVINEIINDSYGL